MTSTIKVNNIQNQCGANIINENSNTITIGASGDTVTLASGASQTGFGRTGTVDWDTTAKTASFTAVSGNGYFIDTSSSAITITLPASPSAGDIVGVNDYARSFATNNLTVARNGSNIQGSANNGTISTNGQSTMFVYVDATKGWIPTEDQSTTMYGAQFITATGGTITTCGNFKIHTFTGPGTFCVSTAGNPAGSNTVDYMVVAGGGAGGGHTGAGGGAGGYRESSGAASGCYTRSPLGACVSALPVTVQGYPITVGSGGSGNDNNTGSSGNNSVFSTITSAGGGGGAGGYPSTPPALAGGSGGGGGGTGNQAGGSGNTPPVSPPQGNSGGTSRPTYEAGGGGGATAAGGDGTPPNAGAGPGGAGATSCITGSPVQRAGGGGGSTDNSPQGTATGGGGAGTASPGSANPGTANTGGGGGGQHAGPPSPGGNGGSGIVVIRYKFQ